MTQSKHTPAPWKIADAPSSRVYLINSSAGHAIGEVVYSDTRNPADARLIAASPTMLAELIQTNDLLQDVHAQLTEANYTGLAAAVSKQIHANFAAIARATK